MPTLIDDIPDVNPADFLRRERDYFASKRLEVAGYLGEVKKTHAGKACWADGKRYASIAEAAQALPLSDTSIRTRIRLGHEGYGWA